MNANYRHRTAKTQNAYQTYSQLVLFSTRPQRTPPSYGDSLLIMRSHTAHVTSTREHRIYQRQRVSDPIWADQFLGWRAQTTDFKTNESGIAPDVPRCVSEQHNCVLMIAIILLWPIDECWHGVCTICQGHLTWWAHTLWEHIDVKPRVVWNACGQHTPNASASTPLGDT